MGEECEKNFKETEYNGMQWIHVAQDRDLSWFFVNTVDNGF
jgi:hypothetical protein